jgi:hypothetical protein
LAPIENRIVRRAILDVLQGYGEPEDPTRCRWAGVPAIKEVMDIRTSLGGIRRRGVAHGLLLIDEAVRSGHHCFVRSDIKDFFTRIPVPDVVRFVSDAVADPIFIALFEAALATHLVNREELEERHLFELFPDGEVGVAQGSALSALAGNIVMRGFDADMNGRGVICIRYVDDFILLGKSESKVRACYKSAQEMLRQMGMEAYRLDDIGAQKAGKVDVGNIFNGTDILGYRVSGMSRQPSSAACTTLLRKIDKVVTDAKREMRAAACGTSTSHMKRYHQSLVLMHQIIWGWSQSFKHTTARQVFQRLDRLIDQRILGLARTARELTSATSEVRRRVMGVHLLGDTALKPLA